MSNQIYRNSLKYYPVNQDILPNLDNVQDLGSSDRRFKHIHVANVTTTNLIATSVTVDNSEMDLLKVNTIQNFDDGDNVKINDILKPSLDATYDLGASDAQWDNAHIVTSHVNTANIVNANITTVDTDTLLVDSIEVGDAQFEIFLDAGTPTIQFDSGDNLTYDRTANEFKIKIAGNPNPDLLVANGLVCVKNKLQVTADGDTFIEKLTTGPDNNDVIVSFNNTDTDQMYWDDSANKLSVNIATIEKLGIDVTNTTISNVVILSSVAQDDTQTKLLVLDGSNNVKWRDVATVEATTGTVTTNWTFPGAVGAVSGDIDWQINNDIANITVPLISNGANGFNAFINNATTLMPVSLRPVTQKNYIVRIENASVAGNGYLFILPTGEIKIYADVALTLFAGAAGTHIVNAVTINYSLI